MVFVGTTFSPLQLKYFSNLLKSSKKSNKKLSETNSFLNLYKKIIELGYLPPK